LTIEKGESNTNTKNEEITGLNGLVKKKSDRSRRTAVTNKKRIIIHKIREHRREKQETKK
jgi:hypothetical protein